MKVWSQGKILNNKAPIDSFNYAMHYACPVVWEGIRSYKQDDDTTKIWKLKDHIDRLFDSAKVLDIKIPYSKAEVEQACENIVQASGGGDLYLRPIVYPNKDAESIKPSIDEIRLDIYCCPVPPFHPSKENGIKAKISSLVRSYPQYNMQAKTAANYNFIQLARQELQNGVEDVFLLDAQGYIVEAIVANIFLVKGDVIMTPPNAGSILPGITRRYIAEILQDASKMFSKYKKVPLVVEKNITRADVYTADEIFLTGTYAEIVPVIEVDSRIIGEGKPGFYTKLLKYEYLKAVKGQK